MIGKVLEYLSPNTDLALNIVCSDAIRATVPLCQTQQMESNHLEGICPLKRARSVPLKQIVPGYQHLKNNYTLLWDMPDNTGYINVVAVMQKFFDQVISGNWSYNPENYPDNEVPTSVMAQDFLRTYKYGWKTSYYQNTYDNKTDEIKEDTSNEQLKVLEQMLMESQEEDCEAAKSSKLYPQRRNK